MPLTITAAVLNTAPGKLELEELVLDDPGPDEVLIDVHYSGLCRSDLHEIEGAWPATCPTLLGHEASGVVRRVGDRVRTLRPGDHVVTCLSIYCGECRFCLSGRMTLCPRRGSLGSRTQPVLVNARGQSVHPTARLGAFAEAMVVHEHSAVRIPDNMPLAAASVLGCAVVTGLSSVFRSARVRPGSTVAVLGCGGIGIAAIQGARLAGAREIIAIDAVEARLIDAVKFGATATVHAGQVDTVAAVRELTEGGVDYSFEAVGLAATVEQAFAMLGPGGTATVVGLVPDSQPISIRASELFLLEKRLQGALMGSNQFPTDIPGYVRYYEQGRLNLDDMLSTTVSLDRINEGFELMKSGGGTRVVASIRSES
ncbi:S-(hydroxymethyl)glutathione dehydrogenase / alcohol dehydrogenase [Nocardia amikacinitolerans]|uniref:Zn-dependent alcohol dehydrogenase n=1 Tax=Nocardia amikacinitolerans TaxID=756689 RepID=UPI000AC87BDF|nr:Zn-dependent alcohol dehydrogenase [Nocardia amikacinitolerans]MCP2319325.1 S-(hydroxymethyl)glutathione dehydrogenase / alcohol dehydrogenase [Nocardia amikacinitolerans]